MRINVKIRKIIKTIEFTSQGDRIPIWISTGLLDWDPDRKSTKSCGSWSQIMYFFPSLTLDLNVLQWKCPWEFERLFFRPGRIQGSAAHRRPAPQRSSLQTLLIVVLHHKGRLYKHCTLSSCTTKVVFTKIVNRRPEA